jgi:DNA processing protein
MEQGLRDPPRKGPCPAITASEAEVDRIRALVEEALGPAPVSVDELIRATGATAPSVLAVLLELELAGRIFRQSGNFVSWS